MLQNKVGVLPVVDNDQILELLQIKMYSMLFLEISGYGQDGIRIGLEVPDNPHVLEKLLTSFLVKISTLNVQLLHQKLIPCFASNYKLKGM